MRIFRPDPKLVDCFVNIKSTRNIVTSDFFDHVKHEEWYNNHRAFVLKDLLPSLKPPKQVWKIVAEGYLTDVDFDKAHMLDANTYAGAVFPDRKYAFEQVLCDGSTLVPDVAYKWGRIKDPWAVGHDLLFLLNSYKLPDIYGKKWTLNQANSMYRNGWYSQHSYIIGSVWWLGLALGSWVVWNSKEICKPECKRFIDNNIPLCNKCRRDFLLDKYDASKHCSMCNKYWEDGVK